MGTIKNVNSALGKLKVTVEHHRALQWMTPFRSMFREMGVGRYLRELEEKDTHEQAKKQEAFRAFYNEHKSELKQVSEMLEDDFSRLTFERLLDYRQTGDAKKLDGIPVYPQYFQKDIFGPIEDEVFVDGGAYVGDTIRPFVRRWGGVQKNICLGT